VGHVKRSNVNTVYLARAPWILHTCVFNFFFDFLQKKKSFEGGKFLTKDSVTFSR
jgi:hypothetical protein